MSLRHGGLLLCLAFASTLFSQNYVDALRPFWGVPAATAAQGIGDVVAPANENALTLNPAVLTSVTQPQTSLDLALDRVRGTSYRDSSLWNQVEDQRFSLLGFSMLYPVPVFRGSWVWGLALQPRRFFDRIRSYDDFNPVDSVSYRQQDQETGGLYAFSLGTAVLVTPVLSLGGSLSYLSGENVWTAWRTEEDPFDLYAANQWRDTLRIAPRYTGWDMILGAGLNYRSGLSAGFAIHLPAALRVSEHSLRHLIEIRDPGWGNDVDSLSEWDLQYRLWGPWRISGGVALRGGGLTLSLSIDQSYYRSVRFRGNIVDTSGAEPIQVEEDINKDLRNLAANPLSIAGGVLLASARTRIMSGFSIQGLPFQGQFDPAVLFNAGLGQKLGDHLELHLSWLAYLRHSDLDHALGIIDGETIFRMVDVEETATRFVAGLRVTL